MKYVLQWKDPDYCDARTGEDPRQEMADTEYQSSENLVAGNI